MRRVTAGRKDRGGSPSRAAEYGHIAGEKSQCTAQNYIKILKDALIFHKKGTQSAKKSPQAYVRDAEDKKLRLFSFTAPPILVNRVLDYEKQECARESDTPLG